MALAIGSVVVIALAVVGVVAFTHQGHHTTADSTPITSSAEPGPTTTTEQTTTTAPTTTTEDPSTDQPSAETTTAAAPTSQGPQPVLALGNNPLFKQSAGLAKVPCTLSTWRSNPQAAQAMFQDEITCLDNAWKPLLQSAGLPFSSPKLVVPASGTGNSPCTSQSTEEFAAYYCEANNTIYMPYQTLQVDQYGTHPGVYIALLAHEYGHHVQTLAGIMPEVDRVYQRDGGFNTDKGQLVSRQLELQAQCFSGMFLDYSHSAGASIDNNIANEAASSQQNRGDDNGNPGNDHSHGTSAHYASWWMQGYQKGDIQQCNTWNSPPAEVS